MLSKFDPITLITSKLDFTRNLACLPMMLIIFQNMLHTSTNATHAV